MAIVTPFNLTEPFSTDTFNSRIGEINTNILRNATKELYGLNEASGPDDAFAFLGKYNQHWWSYTPEAKFISANAVQTNYILQSTSDDNTKVTWYYGTSYVFDNNTGEYTISNPSSISRGYTQNLNELKGTYCMQSVSSGKKMLYLSSDVSISQSYANTYNFVASSCTIYRASLETVTTTYYHSSDRNAYSESDGYVYLGIPFNNAVTPPRIQTGSYVGTGKSGSSNKNSLTFDFEPKFVYVMPSSNGYDGKRLFLIRDCTKSASGTASSTENTIEWSGNTVSWYGGVGQTSHIEGQLNVSGTTYRYFAIG